MEHLEFADLLKYSQMYGERFKTLKGHVERIHEANVKQSDLHDARRGLEIGNTLWGSHANGVVYRAWDDDATLTMLAALQNLAVIRFCRAISKYRNGVIDFDGAWTDDNQRTAKDRLIAFRDGYAAHVDFKRENISPLIRHTVVLTSTHDDILYIGLPQSRHGTLRTVTDDLILLIPVAISFIDKYLYDERAAALDHIRKNTKLRDHISANNADFKFDPITFYESADRAQRFVSPIISGLEAHRAQLAQSKNDDGQ